MVSLLTTHSTRHKVLGGKFEYDFIVDINCIHQFPKGELMHAGVTEAQYMGLAYILLLATPYKSLLWEPVSQWVALPSALQTVVYDVKDVMYCATFVIAGPQIIQQFVKTMKDDRGTAIY